MNQYRCSSTGADNKFVCYSCILAGSTSSWRPMPLVEGRRMAIGGRIGNILLLAAAGASIYALVKWEFIGPQEDEVSDFAEKACVDEISKRYDVSTVRAYSVNETNNGYVVRASVTLARGAPAKVYCLTNAHGGVKELGIEER